VSGRSRPTGDPSPARRFVIGGLSALATLAVAALIGLIWLFLAFMGPGPAAQHGRSTTVNLRSGAGLPEISSSLEDAHVIGSGALFGFIAQVTGASRHLKAGEYRIASRASMASIMDQLRRGRVVRHFVTVPEGMTSDMVVDILMRTPELTGAVPAPPEGTVLPETYEVRLGEDRSAVLQRMMDARDRLIASLWAQRRSGLPFSTPGEAVILASIVEKETGVADERPHVASVFINRLRQNIALASDPTIIYGISRGRPLGRGLRLSELHAAGPYNSYLNTGLPPTPICNPGRASLAAVLDPPDSNDLYFVANGTGGHAFAADLRTHEANVARWRQIEQARAAASAARARTTTTTTTTTATARSAPQPGPARP